jgi:serine/threonine protein kinase
VIGKQVGPYEVIREVGRGTVAVVYRARCPERDREYALRVLERAGTNTGLRERFVREGEAAAGLAAHPGIVTVHEVGEHDGVPFVVMDVVEGRTLASIAANGELTPPEAVSIIAKAARAMHHAHEAGVLHRDLNPANVMLADSRMPRITGFGPSKARTADDAVRELTGLDEVIGTPEYMAPERVRGEPATRATDVYGLAAILYTLCTTRPPFGPGAASIARDEEEESGGVDLLTTLSEVLNTRPVSARRLNRMVEPALDAVILHALQKSPPRRYPTALEFAEDLERVLQGRKTVARSGRLAGWIPWAGKR